MYTYIIEYMVAIIILNKLLCFRSISKKNKLLNFTFTYSFSDARSLCRSEFVNYIIFLLSKNFFQHLLQDRSTGNKFPQFLFVWESLYFSFTFEE